MDAAIQLRAWADEADLMLSRFSRSRDGIHVADGDEARFAGLVLEAREVLKDALGPTNSFGYQLEMTRLEGKNNWLHSQSYHSIEQASGILRAAASTVQRKLTSPPPVAADTSHYVDLVRLTELRSLEPQHWDLRRLVRMCEELNSVSAAGNHHATAMLVRAITDHVPPIFGATNFSQFASSVASRSHKDVMERLSGALRNIADGTLHIQVRRQETLPSATQVNFRAELDVLLAEIVRTLRSNR